MPPTSTCLLGNPSHPSSPIHYQSHQTLLLLLDFHTLFINQLPSPQATHAVSQAHSLRTWARSQHIAVAHCLIDATQPPISTCKDPERIRKVVEMLRGEEELYREPECLRPIAGEEEEEEGQERTFLRTPGYVSALKSKGIEEWLSRKGYKSLILCGLSTSGAVMRTAFAASDAGFVVTVVEDACAERKVEVHRMVVEEVLGSRAYVCRLEDLIEGWSKES